MANIRPKDLPVVTAPTAGDTIMLDGVTTRRITVENLHTSPDFVTPDIGAATATSLNINSAPTGSPLLRVGTSTPLYGAVGMVVANGNNSYLEITDGTRSILAGADVGGTFFGAYSNHTFVIRSNNLNVGVFSVNGFGYPATMGGTVTQATSKSTGVTLSKACGAITMNNAALTADTIVSFVLTNTLIAATDVLILNHISGGTPGSYSLNARAAAGSATIDVRNNTAGSLGEAIVIQFALIKGVNT